MTPFEEESIPKPANISYLAKKYKVSEEVAATMLKKMNDDSVLCKNLLTLALKPHFIV